MSEMKTGTVKFFNTSKGFGFIQPESGADVFVHISAVQRSGLDGLQEGDKVAFDTAIDERSGKTAVDNIKMADQLNLLQQNQQNNPKNPAASASRVGVFL